MSDSVPSIIASYRIVEEIGAVPEGRAFRAVDTRSGDPVLLKILEPPPDPDDRSWQESLQRTRRLGRMSHRSLPILYQIGSSSAGPFIAFSPPAGIPLRQFVSEGGRVDRSRLVAWSSQLLGLLAEAHAEGLLHGHLGVDSVFVGDQDKLYLTGFGLTRLLPDTPEIQPPEQHRGGELSPSGDLYSLAALMKRLGAPVEMGGASTEPLAGDDPLLQVLHRATAEDPGDRFADAVDMDRALRAAAAERAGTRAPAPPTGHRGREESVLPASDPALSTVMIDPGQLQIPRPAPPALEAKDPEVASAFGEALPARRPAPRPAPAPPAPQAATPKPPQRRPGSRRWPWVAVLALLAVAVAYYLLDRGGALPWKALPADGGPTVEDLPPTPEQPPAEEPAAAQASPAESSASAAQDPVLQLARLLAEQEGESLFGSVELEPEEQALMATLREDIEAMDFPAEDTFGGQRARSLFGENPLLGAGNPLLSQELRERWLASAIGNIGPQMALAHLQEETEKLRRGEVDRAQWYEHVAQCKDFCNHVVSGLLFEHVQQVRARPNHLVLFGSGSTEVDGRAQVSLVSFLDGVPEGSRFLLIGRSSRSGNRDRNRELSRQRVEAVLDFFGEQDVPSRRLHSFWLGYEPPQLSAELAKIYGLDDSLPAETLNQSVLVVAFEESLAGSAGT